MNTLLEIFFLPPMAVARLGSSPTPLDSFRWTETTTPQSPADTVIEPAVTAPASQPASSARDTSADPVGTVSAMTLLFERPLNPSPRSRVGGGNKHHPGGVLLSFW